MTLASRSPVSKALKTSCYAIFAVLALSATQAFATGSYSMVVAPTRGTSNANGPGYVVPGPISSTLSPNDTIALTSGGVIVELEIHMVWDTNDPGQLMGSAEWKIDGLTTVGCPNCGLGGRGYDNGVGAPLEPLGFSTGDFSFGAYFNVDRCLFSDREGGANNGFDPPCVPFDPADGPGVEDPAFVHSGQVPRATTLVRGVPDINYEFVLVPNGGCSSSNNGARFYGGTLRLDIPPGAAGTYEIGFLDPAIGRTFILQCSNTTNIAGDWPPFDALNPAFIIVGDCDGDGIADALETITSQQDCDNNGICNGVEIASCPMGDGTCTDCNSNGLPDKCDPVPSCSATPSVCQLVVNDCNNNGILDHCDPDCDADGIPDDCQIIGNDCNANGIYDNCEVGGCCGSVQPLR